GAYLSRKGRIERIWTEIHGQERKKAFDLKYDDVHEAVQRRLKAPTREALKRARLPVGLLLGAIVIFVLLRLTAPTVAPSEPVEKSWVVAAETVNFQDIQPQLALFGEIVAGRDVELRTLVGGPVLKVGENFQNGGIVAKDELLVQIDPFEYQAAVDDAEARLREAKAMLKSERDALVTDRQQLELRQRDYNRAATLHEKGTVSNKFLDDSELALSQARQAVTARENRINIEEAKVAQREVALRRAERDLEKTTLKAPFAGYIDQVRANEGRQLSVNDQVAVISEALGLEVKFTVTDAQYGRILASGESVRGREVRIVWAVGGEPLEYSAVVERVAARIEAESGGIDLYARVKDTPRDAELRPGAFVEVYFPDRQYQDVMRLPERAVFEGRFVYTINEENRLDRRDISIEGYAGDDVFVTGALADGEKVLTTRFPEVGEGVLVDVKN
ncbi:MAG: efflux RND transporter periplasmic adaptor subunit, partial [Alphaproteobacteria bacterium]|nr:efflux RND transporter periplasmic adaptor subunit [Alphaproteobacteria bacterium]